MELTQALVGIDIALAVILTLKVIATVVDHYGWEAARKRFEQELRDHPPSTAYGRPPILSGTLNE